MTAYSASKQRAALKKHFLRDQCAIHVARRWCASISFRERPRLERWTGILSPPANRRRRRDAIRRLRRIQGCRSLSWQIGRGHRHYVRLCWSAARCVARPSQRRSRCRSSGFNREHGLTNCAGLSIARRSFISLLTIRGGDCIAPRAGVRCYSVYVC
jgi:hypothetical protein